MITPLSAYDIDASAVVRLEDVLTTPGEVISYSDTDGGEKMTYEPVGWQWWDTLCAWEPPTLRRSTDPYDAIHVGAAADEVPSKLVEQLRPGGRMIVPVGPAGQDQQLFGVDKSSEGKVWTQALMGVRYVPLVGSEAGTEV